MLHSIAPKSRCGPPPALNPPRLVRQFTVDEYHQMIRAGFFAHDERFELLEGHIVPKAARDPIHDAVIGLVQQLLQRVLPDNWWVRVQSAHTSTDSEPEPDFAIVRGQPRDYLERHPGADDTAVIIEVVNTSLADDRGIKQRVHARAGVREYWIVNFVDRQVEVYTRPSGETETPAYASRIDRKPGDSLTLPLPGQAPIELPVAELLP